MSISSSSPRFCLASQEDSPSSHSLLHFFFPYSILKSFASPSSLPPAAGLGSEGGRHPKKFCFSAFPVSYHPTEENFPPLCCEERPSQATGANATAKIMQPGFLIVSSCLPVTVLLLPIPCETKVASSRAFSLEKSCCCYVQYVQYVYLSNRSLSVPGSAQGV